MTQTPKVYIACLAAYNNGCLHGEWIDLSDEENLQKRISIILNKSPIDDAEEWAVHDHEYCGKLSEYPGMDALNRISEAYQECSDEDINWEVFVEFCSHISKDISPDIVETYKECHQGQSTSILAWCTDHLESTGLLDQVPKELVGYVDTEAYARDYEINYLFDITHGDECHIFRNY